MQKIPRMKKILLKLYSITNFENQSKQWDGKLTLNMGSDSRMSMMVGASSVSGMRLVASSVIFSLSAPSEFSRASWQRQVKACWVVSSCQAHHYSETDKVENVRDFSSDPNDYCHLFNVWLGKSFTLIAKIKKINEQVIILNEAVFV